jgi:AcrR family transcriptional regulator
MMNMMETLPVSFTLSQFRNVTPIDENNIWECLLERNGTRISVKRRDTARENLKKIIIATFQLANTVGFQAMTLRDLCRETGFSMGGLYGYIENKDQLAAMIEDMVSHVTEMVPTWFSAVEQPLDQIESILRAYIYLSEIFQPWLYFVFLESRTLQPLQRAIAKGSELHLQSHLARLAQESAGISADDAFLFAAHCMSLAQDWHLKRWKFGAANIPVDKFSQSVVQLSRLRLQTDLAMPAQGFPVSGSA